MVFWGSAGSLRTASGKWVVSILCLFGVPIFGCPASMAWIAGMTAGVPSPAELGVFVDISWNIQIGKGETHIFGNWNYDRQHVYGGYCWSINI